MAFAAEDEPIHQCRRPELGGLRGKGQTCEFLPLGSMLPEAQRCGEGLRCAGGVCVPRTCKTNDDCPGGQCVYGGHEGEVGWRCQLACVNDEGCGEGHRCVSLGYYAMCLPADQPKSCLESSCGEGEVCVKAGYHPALPLAECRQSCEDGPCPSATVCVRPPPRPEDLPPDAIFDVMPAHCAPICSSNGDCGSSFVCTQMPGADAAYCVLDQTRYREALYSASASP